MSEFAPHLSPVEMLEMGVFGGSYFERATDEDLLGLGAATELAHANRDPFDKRKNYYEVKAGEDYAAWMRNGWIFPEDPLGWFHWYCRYTAGRRHERDEHLGHNIMYSVYKPTPEDIAAIVAGGGIRLGIHGTGHPVFQLGVLTHARMEQLDYTEHEDLGEPI